MNRKEFLNSSLAAMAGFGLAGLDAPEAKAAHQAAEKAEERGSYKEMIEEAIAYPKIDVHNHLNDDTYDAASIDESCRRVGIDWTAVSNIWADTPEEIRENNDLVLEAMRAFPERILGSCYINPGWQKQALEEIDRCVDQGMVMVGETYHDYKVTDPVHFPIIERCIEHDIPFLMHAVPHLGYWGAGYDLVGGQPTTSTAEDLVEIGERYPEAMIIYGHIGGGGDWEYACRVLQDAPSIYVDTSGSVTDARLIDFAVETVGVDRLLFGSDVNYEISVGKIMHADLSEEDRQKIFFDNFNNLLREAGNHVD